MTTQTFLTEYHRQRTHQAAVFASGGGTVTTEPSGRVEYSYAAPYGEHALSAFVAAKRQLYFRKYLSKTVAEHRKRSKAAKRGWKTRTA